MHIVHRVVAVFDQQPLPDKTSKNAWTIHASYLVEYQRRVGRRVPIRNSLCESNDDVAQGSIEIHDYQLVFQINLAAKRVHL